MKRLALALLLALVPVAAFAAARTASNDGVWSDTATWGGFSVPTNADTCTIDSGVEVLCDAAPCTCFNLTISGSLIMKPASAPPTPRKLVIGNNTNTATAGNVTISAGGSLSGDQDSTLEIDISRAASENLGVITNNGVWNWSGKLILSRGTMTALSAISGNHPTQVMTITDLTKPQSAVDSYNGLVLVPRTGYFRGQWLDITTGGVTRYDIVVNMNTRGAIDSRNTTNRVNPTAWYPGDWGMVYSTGNATVASGATTVTFSTAFASVARAEEVLLGSRFACSADIGTAADTDFRRICSITDTTHAELCTAYGTASCNAAAAFRVYDDNMPPYAVAPIEAFSVGDTYDIIDPAVISIPSANQSDSIQTKQMNIILGSGSTTRWSNTEIGYCGQALSGGTQYQCVRANQITNTDSSEGLYIDTVDMHHFSGQYGLMLNDPADMTISWLTIRDASEGGDNAGSEAHSTGFFDSSSSPEMANIILDHWRFVRGNDDCFSWNLTGGDTSLCTNCEIKNGMCAFTPSNDGGSIEGFEPIGGSSGMSFHDNMITNINGELVHLTTTALTDSQSGAYYHNIFQNSQTSNCVDVGSTTEGVGLTVANNKVYVVDNYIAGCRSAGIVRGRAFDNFINMNTKANGTLSTGITYSPEARGNIIIEAGQFASSSGSGINVEPAGANTIIGSTVVMNDNVMVSTTDPATVGNLTFAFGKHGSTAISSMSISADHDTILCHDALDATSLVFGARPNPGNASTFSYTNSVWYDCYDVINESAQAGTGDSTGAYNLFIKYIYGIDGGTDLGNNLTTGTLGYSGLYNGNANALKGSTAWTSLGSDGYPRGARVAGPPGGPVSFRAIYPFIAEFPVVNNIGDSDSDGDGIWNLIDNCDRTRNAYMIDTDSDGLGDACDP